MYNKQFIAIDKTSTQEVTVIKSNVTYSYELIRNIYINSDNQVILQYNLHIIRSKQSRFKIQCSPFVCNTITILSTDISNLSDKIFSGYGYYNLIINAIPKDNIEKTIEKIHKKIISMMPRIIKKALSR